MITLETILTVENRVECCAAISEHLGFDCLQCDKSGELVDDCEETLCFVNFGTDTVSIVIDKINDSVFN